MNFVVGGMVLLILTGAISYIVKAKKAGKRCIGCPGGAGCTGACKRLENDVENGKKDFVVF